MSVQDSQVISVRTNSLRWMNTYTLFTPTAYTSMTKSGYLRYYVIDTKEGLNSTRVKDYAHWSRMSADI